jgi:anaerobic selenocysteine-containing dehydrogenase
MIRENIGDPWREVSWDEAIARTASEFKRIQEKYGRRSIGGITSSRCTNEETFLVQKLIRGGFGNNNVDTCARVCHSRERKSAVGQTGQNHSSVAAQIGRGLGAGTRNMCHRDPRSWRQQADRSPFSRAAWTGGQGTSP